MGEEMREESERANRRSSALLGHLTPASFQGREEEGGKLLHAVRLEEKKKDAGDDVVIVAAVRTPHTRARRGGLKDTPADDLVCSVVEAVLEKAGGKVTGDDIGDVVFGSVLGPSSQRANEVRTGTLLAGLPETVPSRTVNRQCSSGLQALADVVSSIEAGYYTVGIAGGIETMTKNPMAWEGSVNPRLKTHPKAFSCLLPMGITSENVAEKYGITREQQDLFAVRSHARAALAAKTGRFKDEIVPVKTTVKDANGKQIDVVVSEDDGIRAKTTMQTLAKLKPAFKPNGSTTAGNASQVTDGASAVLVMKRSEATRRGLPVLGVWRSFAVVGVDPAIMGIGPAVAIPAALDKAGLSVRDVSLYELNEAFASQASYCAVKLGLDESQVNVNGGSIALGHPLGSTGTRCVGTLLHEMKKRGKGCRYGIVSMCIGTGMGAAAVLERGS